MADNISEGEKKIMNNNPKVASVNMIHDIIGDGGNGLSFKITVIVLTIALVVFGAIMIAYGKIFAGIVLIAIGGILVFTTIGIKYKSKKYKVDKKIMDDIEPLFKD